MTPRGWALFVAMSLLWGIPYLFIAVAIDGGMTPAMIAWGRVVIAAALLLPLAWRAGAFASLRRTWPAVAIFALIEIVVPFPLIAAGQQFVSSSLTAILIATMPLLVALLAVRFDPQERITGTRLIGLLVGLAGVAVLLGIDIAGRPDELLGAGMILVATLGYALGAILVKHRFGDVHPLGPTSGAFAIAAVLLAPVALLWMPESMPSVAAFGSVAVLGIACSALALTLYVVLIGEVGPGRSSVITYVNPLVAVLLGVVLLGERIGPPTIAGLVLILAGSWAATRRVSVPAAAQASP
jgi:drug/metabolite transporter (DMT)-like permease